jgi:aldehyde dehydrogenase (NAD+)
MITHNKLFIGGKWVKPAGSGVIDVISPITEEIFGRVPDATPADMNAAVQAARVASDSGPWAKMSISERGQYLTRMADLLEPQLKEIVEMQINEMGGVRSFINFFTLGLGYLVRGLIQEVQAVPLREVRDGSIGKLVIMRDPVGVVAAITPWNCPIVLILAKLIPALLTGCSIIIKPPPESPLSAYFISEALSQVGLPPGVVSIVSGGREVGEYLISHPGIDKISFTGSTAAGRRIASIAGQNIKSVTLELGGKSAAIVLDDADLDKHLATLINSSIPNSGQACVATTRVLVPARRYDELIERLVAGVSAMKVGNPLDEANEFGPLVAARQRERVENYIRIGRAEGAKLVLGGGRPAIDKGWYVEPTIFADVGNSMRIAQEEIFGPVMSVIRYETEDEAIRIANDSSYGLGGAVFTADIQRGLSVAARIQTGTCIINDGLLGGGGGPMGGVKQSGLGREFASEGINSHYVVKSISLPPGVEPDARRNA